MQNEKQMSVTDDIRRPIERQLEEYNSFLARYMKSDNRYVDGLLKYILENGGKSVRPMTVLLSAALQNPDAEKGLGLRTYLGAMLVEMMHTASLVHDDVIDESDMRRGKPSVRAMLNSRSAVITGDLILAKSINIGLDSAQYDIVDYVVRAMSELCEGELIQSEQSRKLEMTRDIYLDIIRKKTATLFGVSAGVGALSVGALPGQVAEMKRFGEYLGMVFQMKDDILDYDTCTDTGKPACNDLKEQKITLPLLAVLEKSSPGRKAELLDKLAAVADEPENIACLHAAVIDGGGIEESERLMREYISEACGILSKYPVSTYRNSLVLLAGYAGDRQK